MALGPRQRRLDKTKNPTPPQAGRHLASHPAGQDASPGPSLRRPRTHGLTASAWTKAKFSVTSGEALSCLLPALTSAQSGASKRPFLGPSDAAAPAQSAPASG